jgi:hypothetical protein
LRCENGIRCFPGRLRSGARSRSVDSANVGHAVSCFAIPASFLLARHSAPNCGRIGGSATAAIASFAASLAARRPGASNWACPLSLNSSTANLVAQYSSQPRPDTARSPARATSMGFAAAATAASPPQRAASDCKAEAAGRVGEQPDQRWHHFPTGRSGVCCSNQRSGRPDEPGLAAISDRKSASASAASNSRRDLTAALEKLDQFRVDLVFQGGAHAVGRTGIHLEDCSLYQLR